MSFLIEKPNEERFQEIYDATTSFEAFQYDMGVWFEDSVWPEAIDKTFVTAPGEWSYLEEKFSVVTDMEDRLCLRIKFEDLRIHSTAISLDIPQLEIPLKKLIGCDLNGAIRHLRGVIKHELKMEITRKKLATDFLQRLLTVYELDDQDILEHFVVGA